MKLQSFGILTDVLREKHPATFRSMDVLATNYMNQGRWKEAEQLPNKVLELDKEFISACTRYQDAFIDIGCHSLIKDGLLQ